MNSPKQHNCDENAPIIGKARLTQVPPDPLYVSTGETARFIWDYTVDNKELQLLSPAWKYYYANGTAVDIGYGKNLKSLIIQFQTCPSRLLNPTVRVSKESTATLVISNVTTADSGIYEIVLLLKAAPPRRSQVQLIVTTRPKFTSQIPANIIVLEGKDLRINCSASGIPAPNITLVLLKDQTNEIRSKGVGYCYLYIQNITRHQNGTYQCQATNNPNESPVKNGTEVTIWYKPYIKLLNFSVDEKIILFCLASGQPNPLITWYYQSGKKVESGITEIAGGSRMVLEIADFKAISYCNYKCNATNQVGWQVGCINIIHIDRPTTKIGTEKEVTLTTKHMKTKGIIIKRPSSTSIATSYVKEKGKSDLEKTKYKKNVNNVALLCVFGVLLPIIITVSVVLVLRKRCRKSDDKENRSDVDHDKNLRLRSLLPEPSNIVNYDEVRSIPIYAQVDNSKEGIDRQNDNMPIYAKVDKRKKRRPGQVIYAELEDIKSSAETPCAICPPQYIATEYADIKQLNNQKLVSHPEPIYETLPDN